MDFYSASGMPLLWTCFFQTIAIGWVFGTDNFCDCVEEMTGKRPGLFWFMCWKYLAPTVMFVSIHYIIDESLDMMKFILLFDSLFLRFTASLTSQFAMEMTTNIQNGPKWLG